MKIKCVFLLIFLFLAALLRVSPMMETRAGSSLIKVPDDFPTIQQAIDAAQIGSIVLVNRGVYHENLLINKTLTMQGTDWQTTVIEGSVNITGADNSVVNGFTVRNSSSCGIDLFDSNCSVISGNVVTVNPYIGIALDFSCNNTISGNIVLSNRGGYPGLVTGDGIGLLSSSNNTLSNNIIKDSVTGLDFAGTDSNNIVFGNVFEMNDMPVFGLSSSNNATFFSNNFMDPLDSFNFSSPTNRWSLGDRGNYWNDYTGLDDGSGGRVAGDGVGDTNLPWHGVDYYPLINPVNPLQILWDNKAFPVSLVSDGTVSAFDFDQADREVTFNLNGPANPTGYFNLSVPTTLLSGPWKVLLDGTDVTQKAVMTENQTYTSIYFDYNYSAHNVQVIGTDVLPEYPTTTALPLLALAALPLLVFVARKRRKRQTRTKSE